MCTTSHKRRQQVSPPAATVAASSSAALVPLADTVMQLSKLEVPVLSKYDLTTARMRYVSRQLGQPPIQEDVSKEQLTALHAVIFTYDNIYADFSVWVPNGSRLLKKKRFIGLVLNPQGKFVESELLGPPGIHAWTQCYQAFATACVMLGVLSPAILRAYNNKIQAFASEYPSCWALIYQCEARTRLEHVTRVRWQLEQ